MNDDDSSDSKQEEQRKRNDKINNQVLKQFLRETREEFSVKTMTRMVPGSGASDFDAMRLLILTMKFLIECETSFDLNIKCIKPYTLNDIITNKEFSDIEYVKQLAIATKNIYDSKRNDIANYEKLLAKEMIQAIR